MQDQLPDPEPRYERLDLPDPQGDPRPLELPDPEPSPTATERAGVAGVLHRKAEEKHRQKENGAPIE